jgi:hypothetical protein
MLVLHLQVLSQGRVLQVLECYTKLREALVSRTIASNTAQEVVDDGRWDDVSNILSTLEGLESDTSKFALRVEYRTTTVATVDSGVDGDSKKLTQRVGVGLEIAGSGRKSGGRRRTDAPESRFWIQHPQLRRVPRLQ